MTSNLPLGGMARTATSGAHRSRSSSSLSVATPAGRISRALARVSGERSSTPAHSNAGCSESAWACVAQGKYAAILRPAASPWAL